MDKTEQIRVMIVDDHEMVRKGAKGYLEAQAEIKVVAEAESGEQAVGLAVDVGSTTVQWAVATLAVAFALAAPLA